MRPIQNRDGYGGRGGDMDISNVYNRINDIRNRIEEIRRLGRRNTPAPQNTATEAPGGGAGDSAAVRPQSSAASVSGKDGKLFAELLQQAVLKNIGNGVLAQDESETSGFGSIPGTQAGIADILKLLDNSAGTDPRLKAYLEETLKTAGIDTNVGTLKGPIPPKKPSVNTTTGR